MTDDCDICYTHPNGDEEDEHLIVPLRDLAFLSISLVCAFDILEARGFKISDKEKKIARELFEKYRPHVYYNSSGRFFNKTYEEIDDFKFKHESYL